MNTEEKTAVKSIRASKQKPDAAPTTTIAEPLDMRLKKLEEELKSLVAGIAKRMDDVDFDIEDLFKKFSDLEKVSTAANADDFVTFSDLRKFIAARKTSAKDFE